MKKCRRKIIVTRMLAYSNCFVASFVFAMATFAQDGTAGINEANTKVRSYFSAGTNLMYAVGAIVGLIGAIKVFNKWSSYWQQHPDGNRYTGNTKSKTECGG